MYNRNGMEFIAYKAGYLTAKQEIAEKIHMGSVDLFSRGEIGSATWFSFGYDDCYDRMFLMEQNGITVCLELLSDRENIDEQIKECFETRVNDENKLYQSSVRTKRRGRR